MIIVNTNIQTLTVSDAQNNVIANYPVSTAKNGLGERKNSFQTPRGHHVVRAKIGAGCPLYTVFKERRPTGEIWNTALQIQYPTRDWILTRILWLSGLVSGFNRLGCVDTMQRFIYIHGTADEARIGQPVSQGCIRMRNSDVMDLFDRIEVGECVVIT